MTEDSISEYLGYPVCGLCKERIRSALGQFRGIAYHILTNEKGENCLPKDSCLGQAIEKHLKSIS